MSFRILILGGGFTGLEAARRLAVQANVTVTVVDPESHALFTPRLVDALAQDCREADLRTPHTALAERHRYHFVQGCAQEINDKEKTVLVNGTDGTNQTIPYDTLVCAYGASTNFYKTEGKEFALPFKTWDHLLRVETKLGGLARGKAPLRIAIIGGGATGIEAACALDLRLKALGRGVRDRTITIFQAGPQIVPGFLPKTVERTHALLKELGITVRLATPVKRLLADGLETQNSEHVTADLILWAAGVRPNQVDGDTAADSPTTEMGTDYTLRVRPHVFAGGDVIQLKDGQQSVPKNAQTALKMGASIAENIMRERAGKPLACFRYRSPGVMLWLGKTAITDLFGFSLPSRAFVWVRKLFYRLRWRQMAG